MIIGKIKTIFLLVLLDRIMDILPIDELVIDEDDAVMEDFSINFP